MVGIIRLEQIPSRPDGKDGAEQRKGGLHVWPSAGPGRFQEKTHDQNAGEVHCGQLLARKIPRIGIPEVKHREKESNGTYHAIFKTIKDFVGILHVLIPLGRLASHVVTKRIAHPLIV